MANLPEEYVALYLRLNGFLLLTNFTHLSNKRYIPESDIIGLKCPKYAERVNGDRLSIDENLFSDGLMNKNKVIPIICEVKGGKERPTFQPEKIEYLRDFYGDYGTKLFLMGVSRVYDEKDNGLPKKSPKKKYDRINIGLNYIYRCTREIVKNRAEVCNKANSWFFGGSLLQELLLFDKIS